jgi:hypothetical protein
MPTSYMNSQLEKKKDYEWDSNILFYIKSNR